MIRSTISRVTATHSSIYLRSIWNETERRLGTCVSREPSEFRESREERLWVSREKLWNPIRSYVSITGYAIYMQIPGQVLSSSIKLSLPRALFALWGAERTSAHEKHQVRSGPDPAPRHQQPLITKNFMSPRCGFCHLFAQARRKSELIDYLLICNVVCLENAHRDPVAILFVWHVTARIKRCIESKMYHHHLL